MLECLNDYQHNARKKQAEHTQ